MSTTALAQELLAGRWGTAVDTPEQALEEARWLRLHPVIDPSPSARLLLFQQGIEQTWETYLSGRGVAASRGVTDLYLREFEPAEAHLETYDRSLRKAIEASIISYRRALQRNIVIAPGALFAACCLNACIPHDEPCMFRNCLRLACGAPCDDKVEAALKTLGTLAADIASGLDSSIKPQKAG